MLRRPGSTVSRVFTSTSFLLLTPISLPTRLQSRGCCYSSSSTSGSDDQQLALQLTQHFHRQQHSSTQLATFLRDAVSQCDRWFKSLIQLPDGTKTLLGLRYPLVQLHQQLIDEKQDAKCISTALECATTVLRSQLEASLRFQEFTWTTLSAAAKEQVLLAERVHPFSSLLAVQQRMAPAPHRRMFGFFADTIRDLPLVQVQVALTSGIATSIDSVLRRPPASLPSSYHQDCEPKSDGKQTADTAIFYSISSQPALTGIELGSQLISSTMKLLKSDSSVSITTFSTLSPIPSLNTWLVPHALRVSAASSNAHDRKLKSLWAVSFAKCLTFRNHVGDTTKKDREEDSAVTVEQTRAAETMLRILEEIEQRPVGFSDLRGAIQLFFYIITSFGTRDGANNRGSGSGSTAMMHDVIFKAGRLTSASDERIRSFFRARRKADDDEEEKEEEEEEEEEQQTRKNGGLTYNVALWTRDPEFARAAVHLLQPAVSDYLVQVRRRAKPFCPVATFHCRNGAVLASINPLSDTSLRGSEQSCCFCVNYKYDPEMLDERKKTFASGGLVPVLKSQ